MLATLPQVKIVRWRLLLASHACQINDPTPRCPIPRLQTCILTSKPMTKPMLQTPQIPCYPKVKSQAKVQAKSHPRTICPNGANIECERCQSNLFTKIIPTKQIPSDAHAYIPETNDTKPTLQTEQSHPTILMHIQKPNTLSTRPTSMRELPQPSIQSDAIKKSQLGSHCLEFAGLFHIM